MILQGSLVFKHISTTFLFMGYSRRILNYLERIVLFDPTHLMSMANLVIISVETLHIDSR